MMENADHKRAWRFKKASRPQSVPANGRKTPEGNLSTLEKTEKKVRAPKDSSVIFPSYASIAKSASFLG